MMSSLIKNIANGTLKSKLIELIRVKGALSVKDYMKIVLTNPESGFYMNSDVFGVKGHFTTNPEISQIFGEILGVWIIQEWKRFGCPKPLKLIEFGPGRGTLMSDIARTLNAFGQTKNQFRIYMIEMSPQLTEIQKRTLSQLDLAEKSKWFTHISQLKSNDGHEQGFEAFIAHEYLDALPIFKFVRDPKTNSWRELMIDYDENQELRFCISRNPSLSARLLVPENCQHLDHLEVCPEAATQLEKVADRLNESKSGCMLICDYGFEDEPELGSEKQNFDSLKSARSNRDTFRAFKNHEPWHPLRDPGEADLTADVDFGFLKRHLSEKALLFGPVNQSDFLLKCGLRERLQVLLNNEGGKQNLISGSNMMLNEMGQRYKFLSFFPKQSNSLFEEDPPAGFGS